MSYYMNVFDVDWSGCWVLADLNFMPQFKIGPNKNTADWMLAWVAEPYDFSTNNAFTINYAFDLNLKNYASLSINVAGATPSATLATEVCAALNGNASFAELWLAVPLSTRVKGGALGAVSQALGVNNINSPNPGTAIDQPSPGPGGPYTVLIKSVKRPKQSMRVYISNTGAELALGFNRKAPVAQLPSYFSRHDIANRFTFTDCTATLLLLDTTLASDQQVITNAGQDYTTVTKDWQFLTGRTDVFKTYASTYTVIGGTTLPVTQIEYNTGAQVGDLAKKTYSNYSTGTSPAAGTLVSQVDIPYVLTSGDLLPNTPGV